MVDPNGVVRCAFCKETTLKPFMDFGEVALAGAFLKEAQFTEEQKYPLTVCFCTTCYAVQVERTVNPEVLFRDYFYFSSAIGTLRSHFAAYAKEVTGRFLSDPSRSTVVEIGCNDGVLLKPLKDEGIGTIIGVDPARNVVDTINDPRIIVVNDFFGTKSAGEIATTHGKADLICANNVFAHIEDINDVIEGVANLLKDEGVFVFEVHYLGSVIEGMQYDMIYHEHLYYHSVLALDNHFARYGLRIFGVTPVPIHGGSIRVCVGRDGSAHAVMPSVEEYRTKERALGYDTLAAYLQFASACDVTRKELRATLSHIRESGGVVAGYGASGRANTILQYCGFSPEDLAYIVDDAPAKQGFYTPGTHIPITSSTMLAKNPPTHLLVFAWAFYEEIRNKSEAYIKGGGKFILPLPSVLVE